MKIRVLSYNIHKGFSTTGTNFTLHQIRESLRLTNPDILLLQEVVGENFKHKKNIPSWPLETQFEFLADSFWHHYSYGKNAIYDGRHHGNAILSKFPISFYENINISTNKWEQRGLLHVVLDLQEQQKMHIFNVHLNLLERSRKLQIQQIIDHARNHVPENCSFLLGGDFNDWTGNIHNLCAAGLGAQEAHHAKNNKLAPSFPSFFPRLSLDRLYFKKLSVLDAKVLQGNPWSSLSDHLPLLVEFEMNQA